MVQKNRNSNLSFRCNVDTGEPDIIQKINLFIFDKYFNNGKKVLDIGCWTGGWPRLLVKKNVKVYALEPSAPALHIARSDNKNVSFKQGSVFKLPYENDSFDVVTFWMVLEHLPNKSEGRALLEIKRVLKPGGFLLLSTPHWQWANNIMDVAHFLKGHRHYSRKKLTALITSSGLDINDLFVRGGFWNAFSVDIFYFYKHLLNRNLPATIRSKFNERIKKEFLKPGGFTDLYTIAKKI